MKIAIDCRMVNNSGIGNVLKCILMTRPENHSYILLGKAGDLKDFITDKTEILDCSIPIFSVKELFCFPIRIVNKCDAFFSPNYNIPFFITAKKYSMIHDVVFLDVPGIVGKIGYITRYLYLLRAVLVSQKIFTVSDFSKTRIVHYFRHERKVQKITLSVPLPLKQAFPYLKKMQMADYFIYVGNLKKHKGIEVLIEAFNKYTEKSVKLYIVGKKEAFKTSLETSNLSVDENVVFTGYVDDDVLYNLIYNAKALIQPSFYEGFGIPPLEALFLNTPVILSDIQVFKEIYRDLPVVFFRCGDSDDLLEKMQVVSSIFVSKELLAERFDFSKSEKIIFSTIENDFIQRLSH